MQILPCLFPRTWSAAASATDWITINSPKSESFMTVTNKGTKPCRAELAFKYMLKIKDEAKSAGYEKEIRYLDYPDRPASGLFEKAKAVRQINLSDHGRSRRRIGRISVPFRPHSLPEQDLYARALYHQRQKHSPARLPKAGWYPISTSRRHCWI